MPLRIVFISISLVCVRWSHLGFVQQSSVPYLTVGALTTASSVDMLQPTCVFGCSCSASDSLEHYCRCPVVLQVLHRKLRVKVTPRAALRLFMLDIPRSDDNLLKCSALINYVVYNTFNAFRAKGTIRTPVVSADALV